MWNSDNPSSRNYAINTCSQVSKSPDPFWTKFQGWYNPTTFSMIEVHQICSEPKSKDDTILPPSRWPKFTGSILNQSSRMIQSCHILDEVHRITSRHMSQDDTIPLHSQRLRSPDHFWTYVPGWYNPIATSLLPLSRKVFPNHTKLVSKVFELYSGQRLRQHITI